MKKTIEKRLDTVFKLYVRRKATPQGYGNCVSCGTLKPFEELDGGHYINCKWRSTRWHEENVHIQCRACNRFDEGNKTGYALYMLERYGKEKVEYLQALSRTRAGFTDFDGEMMVKDYKQRLLAMQKPVLQ